MIASFQALREGRIQVKVDAEDRLLLDELVLQARGKHRGRRSRATLADVLIPPIRAWCRRPRRLRRVRIDGKPLRVDCRLPFPHDRLGQRFADKLQVRGENNASAVLRAIIRELIEPIRGELKRAAREREAYNREREADNRQREARQRRAEKQRQYRIRIDEDGLAEGIELFLVEMGENYRRRGIERIERDAEALSELGMRVADLFVAATNAMTGRDSGKAGQKQHSFADQLVRKLGFALARPMLENLPTTRCSRCSKRIVSE